MGGSYDQVNKGAGDKYEFADPTGQFQGAVDQAGRLQGVGRGMMNQDPQAFMNQFQQAAPGMSNLAFGATSPLQQGLNAQAADQARRGAEMAGQEFANNGALGSGAAARAMGTAMAQPFADVQNQLGQQQVQLTGNLWNQGLGQFGGLQQQQESLGAQLMGQGLQTQGQLAAQMGGSVAPQYEYAKGPWDYTKEGIGAAGSIAGAVAPFVTG